MPTHTLTINPTTFPVGLTTVGPLNVGNNTSARIVTDRTVAGGLNSLTSASTVAVMIQISPDNGTTWADLCGATWVGGIYTGRAGQLNSDSIGTGDADTATRVRVLMTVAGPSSVVIAGTVTVT